ncbi:MAG TPA: ribonuclease P protein component, partial [Bacteroidales bacterium]|nr:ribonuclease P protein component [Bacteroidales bacterium]
FKKAERLCSLKTIGSLFDTGRSFNLQGIRVVYMFSEEDTLLPPARILISVPKRNFKRAVDRNLLKRRIREAYRKNKAPLYDYLKVKNKRVDFAIIWTATTILPSSEITALIEEMIKRLSA